MERIGLQIVVATPSRPHPVEVGAGLLPRVGEMLVREGLEGPVLLVTDSTVDSLYGDVVRGALSSAGLSPRTRSFCPGEASKSLDTVRDLYRDLVEMGADRKTPLVGLGGGVVTDLTGFAAATFMRGVPWVALPTTLLAQVDASIGGKTGVNLPEGKNLVGAFHPPLFVLADVTTLSTLPARHVSSGLAEAAKVALALSPSLLDRMEEHAAELLALDFEQLTPVLAGAIREKAAVVAEDEREEGGRRRILNLGHTAGHAIEAAAGFGPVLHGEAVSVGILAAVRVSERRGLTGRELEERVAALLGSLKLPVSLGDLPAPVRREDLFRFLPKDKKRRGVRLHLVLPVAPGRTEVVVDGTPDEVARSLR